MKQNYAIAIILCSVFLPTGIFVHECGHYFAARAFGWETRLTPAYVPFRAANLDAGRHFLFLFAGPIWDVFFITTGLLIFRKVIRNVTNSNAPIPWSYWLATALTLPAIRWLVAPFTGTVSDESKMSSLLGMHYLALPLMMLVPGLIIVATVVRIHWRHRTILALLSACVCAFFAVGLWVNVIGPMLL